MPQPQIGKALAYWRKLGPGLITGAADDDPSGIATYSQAGAQYGTGFIWLSVFTFPLMALVQEMCARIGMVTGKGLATNIKEQYPRGLLIFCTVLLFVANTFNIGADLGAMAQATRLILPAIDASFLVVIFTIISLVLQIFTRYKTYASYLKWLTLVLFSYILVAFVIHLDWVSVVHDTFIPHFPIDKNGMLLVAAILGTTISPYLFFWQSSQEVEEKKELERLGISNKAEEVSANDIKNMQIDVWSGMFISNLAMFFIIAVCSGTLFSHGITTIKTAADAALALRPLAGNGAFFLFAIGIIGTGFLAVPILAGSVSYAVSESMNWKEGLNNKFKEAQSFYGVLIIAMLVGLALNFIGLDPIKALIYSAIANCIVAPFILFFVVLISSNKAIMGKYASGRLARNIGFMITFLMFVVGISTVAFF